MRDRGPRDIDDLQRDLREALGAIPKDRQPRLSDPGPGRAPRMALPPGLAEEAARILFEFWEQQAEKAGHRVAIRWERLSPQFQVAWVEIARVVVTMAIQVVLVDLDHYLDSSNGDMGAAFSRALRRYAASQLQHTIASRDRTSEL